MYNSPSTEGERKEALTLPLPSTPLSGKKGGVELSLYLQFFLPFLPPPSVSAFPGHERQQAEKKKREGRKKKKSSPFLYKAKEGERVGEEKGGMVLFFPSLVGIAASAHDKYSPSLFPPSSSSSLAFLQ